MWPWSRAWFACKKLYQNPCSSFERNTFLFSETVVEFTGKKAWKMAEVGNCFNRSLTVREEHLKKKRFNAKEILTVAVHHTTD